MGANWLCTKLVSCAVLGLPLPSTCCCAACSFWFPCVQIALPLARNAGLDKAAVDVVVLLLLLPQPTTATPTINVAATAHTTAGRPGLEASLFAKLKMERSRSCTVTPPV